MDAIDKILQRLDYLRKYTNFLKNAQTINFEKYTNDFKEKSSIERNFQLAIECCLDIAELFISDLRLPQPSEHRNAILILGEHNIINETLSKKMADAVSFRNLLVHDYIEIDDKKSYENLKNIKDFDEFINEVRKYLDQ